VLVPVRCFVPIEDAAARRPVAPKAIKPLDDPAAVQSSFRRTDAARGSMKVMQRNERGRKWRPVRSVCQ